MNEAEWLACTDVTAMLTCLEGKVSARKLRLFGVGCCTRVWHLLTDSRSRRAVKVAARFADGEATERERADAYLEARQVVEEVDTARRRSLELNTTPMLQAAFAARNVVGPFRSASDLAAVTTAAARARRAALVQASFGKALYDPGMTLAAGDTERAAHATLLRDVVPPFGGCAPVPDGGGRVVQMIARACYQERDFRSLPVLADALEDVGYTDPIVLDHCRGRGDHVRGCWVLDLLLGRK